MAQVNIHYASMTVEHIDQKKAMTVGGILLARYIMAYTTTNHIIIVTIYVTAAKNK